MGQIIDWLQKLADGNDMRSVTYGRREATYQGQRVGEVFEVVQVTS